MRVYNGILVDGVLHVPDGDYKKTCGDCSLYEICNEAMQTHVICLKYVEYLRK